MRLNTVNAKFIYVMTKVITEPSPKLVPRSRVNASGARGNPATAHAMTIDVRSDLCVIKMREEALQPQTHFFLLPVFSVQTSR